MANDVQKARPLGLGALFAFGALSAPLAVVTTVCQTYLPRYLVGLGMSFLAVGAAISLVRVIDIGLDPLIAIWIDRTRTRLGRYRPWLIAGVPVVLAGLWMLLGHRGKADTTSVIVWLLVVYAGLSMLSLSLNAWAARLAPGYDDRSRVYAFMQALSVLGPLSLALLPLASRGRLVAGKGSTMPAIVLMLAVALPLTVALVAFALRERPGPTVDTPRYSFRDAVTLLAKPSMRRIVLADFLLALGHGTTPPLYVFFFHDAKGFSLIDTATLVVAYKGAGVLGAPLWGRIAMRVGKDRAAQFAAVAFMVTQVVLIALPRMTPGYTWLDAAPTFLTLAVIGACLCAFPVLMQAMTADVADEVKLDTGHDATTLLFSLISTTTKFAGSVGVMITFPILQLFHYNGAEGAVNAPQAIWGLELCYVIPPLVITLAGALALFGYPLTAKRHSDIVARLAAAAPT